ncbi:MAG: cupin domain-containing protein [Rikenellaceae bacterium]|nr:cupin domain-containing protein [Rikenellaceae bacterium]
MATIIKSGLGEFHRNPGRIDPFRLSTDVTRVKKGVEPRNLHFDIRLLGPGEYSSPYHFHRYAEELFSILSGSATLRTWNGLEKVEQGDIIFFESGQTGAHQLHNHTAEPCIYLDVRSFTGQDVCEYPDSGKLLLVPSMEIFKKGSDTGYFDGEENIGEIWRELGM